MWVFNFFEKLNLERRNPSMPIATDHATYCYQGKLTFYDCQMELFASQASRYKQVTYFDSNILYFHTTCSM